jgi:hypothetical protein
VLKSGVAVYGGFAGTETLLSQRNATTNVTILSGDIGVIDSNTDNSYNVGRPVWRRTAALAQGDNYLTLDLSGCGIGVYYLSVGGRPALMLEKL